jgi:hypothetical protein
VMTKRRNDNVLALPPLRSDFGTTANTSLVPWSARKSLNKNEKRLIESAHEQWLTIDIIATKARFGTRMIGEIHKHGSLTFDEATSFIVDIKDQPGRSQQHQAYIDQFSERQIQLLAQQALAAIDVSATGIGVEIHRDPHPPDEPEPRPGFLQRVFGK